MESQPPAIRLQEIYHINIPFLHSTNLLFHGHY